MATISVQTWYLIWPDGRAHPHCGARYPARWDALVASDGCRVEQLEPLTFELPSSPTPQRGTVKPAA